MKRLWLLVVLGLLALVLPSAALGAGPLDIASLDASAQPNANGWSSAAAITFTWSVAEPGAAAGYSFLLTDQPGAQPDDVVDGSVSAATYPGGGPTDGLDYGVSGDLFFTVRACDADGNWGEPSTIEVRNDEYPPQIDGLSFNGDWAPDATDLALYFDSAVTVGWGADNPDPPELSGIWTEELRIDGGAWSTDTVIPAPTDHSNDGPHTATMRVTDLAGNANQRSRSLVIDTTPPVTTLSPADGLWHRAGDYALAATDALSGVAHTLWTIDKQAIGFTEAGDGVHSISYWSIDKAGNQEAPNGPQTIRIDDSPPISVVAGNDDDWHRTSVPLSFGALDAFSGVGHIESSVDGGAWIGGASRTIQAKTDHSADGIHSVLYRAVDKVGNVEDPNAIDVRIDTTAPTTTQVGADGAWHNKDVKVALSASDAASGVAETDSWIDGGDPATDTVATVAAPASHANDGVHTVSFQSTDMAGNVEAPKAAVVKIDTTPPVTTDSSDTDWHRAGATVTLTASDAASGVAETDYRVDGGTLHSGTAVAVSGDGAHTVVYHSIDAAGNTEPDRSCVVKVDGSAPATK
jgi:large repetitive protein